MSEEDKERPQGGGRHGAPPETGEFARGLISGYLDGELDGETRATIERRIEQDAEFRKEVEKMRRFVRVTTAAAVDQPPEEAWDHFLEGVYNRLERQTGWIFVILGVVVLSGLGIYAFVKEPGAWWLKVLIATPVVGLGILFLSVLRERLQIARFDRYSREVKW